MLTLQGCTSLSSEISNSDTQTNVQQKTAETITVKRGNITPTLSVKQTVAKASPFTILTIEKGEFSSWVETGYKVRAGDILGYNNDRELISPVDAKVVSRIPDGILPAHYPAIVLEYIGFSFRFDGTNFFKNLPIESLMKGRYQITNGIGPNDIKAIVVSATNALSTTTNTDSSVATSSESSNSTPISKSSQSEFSLQALVNIDDDVREGQEATVVLTADVKQDVLILPLSTVAGRFKKGSVTLIEGENRRTVDVTLGVTDGMYIEIVSGLKEGDVISSIPPNLDPRNP
ncbi:efflux RND transporter periplasmic adaptor subunit [Streptococcus suis]|nr:efflux RND transporter periplasmic adaptor subunit [Streptococcus suis]